MKEEGITEGFYLMYEHHYPKGIFCFSSLLMMQVTIIDNMMKISAKDRYAALYLIIKMQPWRDLQHYGSNR